MTDQRTDPPSPDADAADRGRGGADAADHARSGADAADIDPSPLRVRDLLTHPLVTATPEASILAAARCMTDVESPSLIVVGADGAPLGIVTDSDLRRRVVAAGRDIGRPVTEIASAPIVTIDADALFFEAAHAMLSHGVHHLVVLDEGRPLGILADSDLLAAQGHGPLFVSRRIAQAGSVDALAALRPARVDAVRLLVQAGASGEAIGRLTAELNDQLTRRILVLLESKLGPPPVPYCWLGIGSEGRREQGLRTDQDNALIYDDPPPGLATVSADYFEQLAARACDALVACGFPRCHGGMMATNPRWRMPLRDWLSLFAAWMRRPEPEAIYGAEILFDFRAVAGDLALADALWDDVLARIARSPVFMQLLQAGALEHRPAVGLFGRVAVEHGGAHRGMLHLKHRAIMPVVEVVRAVALAHGLRETNTFERLRALRDRGVLPPQDAQDVLAALELFSRLRFRRHLTQIDAGHEPDDYLDPSRLPRGERLALRAYLQHVAQVQEYLGSRVALGGRA